MALWIEGFSEGKPLTFLDAHIKCGDSLVGVFDLKVLDAGIPDEAFDPVTGDDKAVARGAEAAQQAGARRANWAWPSRKSRPRSTRPCASGRPSSTARKTPPPRCARSRPLTGSCNSRRTPSAPPATCGRPRSSRPLTAENIAAGAIPTTATLQDYRRQPGAADPRVVAHARALAVRNQFFHWPLEFPHVFAAGGFTVMLGNPPWERIKLQEQEFFAARDPEIAAAPNKAARQRLIDALRRTNPGLAREFEDAKHTAEAQASSCAVGPFPADRCGRRQHLCPVCRIGSSSAAPKGRAGIIVPTGIATDDTTKGSSAI